MNPPTTTPALKTLTWIAGRKALVAGGVLLAALCGCTDRDGNPPSREQVNAAVDKTEAATVAAARKAAELAEAARDKTVAFAKSPQVKQDAANAKQALERAVDDHTRQAHEPARP